MPEYLFKDKNTQELFYTTIKISEYDSFLLENPSLERYYTSDSAPVLVSGVGGIKNDSGWKEVLSKVAEKHPKSELAARTLTKTSREVKRDEIVKKHLISSK